jgi:hypothetical protein
MTMSSTAAKAATNDLKNGDMSKKDVNSSLILVRLRPAHKFVFIVGVLLGFYAARNNLALIAYEGALTAARGYEYDADNDCVVVRKKKGDGKFCRPMVDCSKACQGMVTSLSSNE